MTYEASLRTELARDPFDADGAWRLLSSLQNCLNLSTMEESLAGTLAAKLEMANLRASRVTDDA
jgi:hypothetical protein